MIHRFHGRRPQLRAVVGAAFVLAAVATSAPARAQDGPDTVVYEAQIYTLVNEVRARHGLPALRRDSRLDTSARNFSRYMGEARFFGHVGPDGRTMSQRMASQGYRASWWGENIAAGYDDPVELVAEWMASPSHRANILSRRFRYTGVGVAFVNGFYYVTHDFGAERRGRRKR
jgi:uncharacterized protein YkwD